MADTFRQDLKKFNAALDAFVDAHTVHVDLKENHEKELVNAVIGTAKAGIAPGDNAYDGYSAAYQKRIDKAGGRKFWLRGIGRGGRSGGMLDPGNFAVKVDRDGKAWLQWTPGDERQSKYGPVHQGTEFGGQDHTKRDIPARPWLHFANSKNANALNTAYKRTFKRLAAMFNAGTLKKK